MSNDRLSHIRTSITYEEVTGVRVSVADTVPLLRRLNIHGVPQNVHGVPQNVAALSQVRQGEDRFFLANFAPNRWIYRTLVEAHG